MSLVEQTQLWKRSTSAIVQTAWSHFCEVSLQRSRRTRWMSVFRDRSFLYGEGGRLFYNSDSFGFLFAQNPREDCFPIPLTTICAGIYSSHSPITWLVNAAVKNWSYVRLLCRLIRAPQFWHKIGFSVSSWSEPFKLARNFSQNVGNATLVRGCPEPLGASATPNTWFGPVLFLPLILWNARSSPIKMGWIMIVLY